MTQTLELIICGVSGRMGKCISELALEKAHIRMVGTAAKGSLGKVINARPKDSKPVIIDFTHFEAVTEHAHAAESAGLPLVIGTTGLNAEHLSVIQTASQKIPVLVSANMSLGANLLYALTHMASRTFVDADIEICESHHRAKKDAPSGTAYFLGEAAAKARNQNLSDHLVLDRSQHGPRKSGEIGIVGLRGGNTMGEHSVYFFGNNETIELKHHVSDRRIFAEGAILAARYLSEQKPGLYNMLDVLNIKLA